MTPEQVRKEYAKLRSIANKRIARFKKDPIFRQSETAKREFVPSTKSKNPYLDLLEVSNFLRQPTTLREERRHINDLIKALNESGYKYININNIFLFIQFMQEVQEAFDHMLFDSDVIAKLFNEGMKNKISEDDLRKMVDEYMGINDEDSSME